ncbi:MAG: hypothetical protein N4A65_00785 [Cohaesibacter sp.]|jgi:hypothetical protein|nr:hypothetical protein [Cohaesibacter sp.]
MSNVYATLTHTAGIHRKTATWWAHWLVGLYAFGWSVTLELGVRLYVAEVIALIGVLFVVSRPRIAYHGFLVKIIFAYFLWVFAIIFSDLVNDVAVFDTIKALSTPMLGGISLIFLVCLISRDNKTILTFLIFTIIGKLLLGEAGYKDQISETGWSLEAVSQNTNYFKIYFAPFLTPIIILAGFYLYKISKFYLFLLYFISSLFYFYLDSRSLGLILALSSLYVIFISYKFDVRKLVLYFPLFFAFLYFLYAGYVGYSLSFNEMGHNALQLQRLDNPYNPFALLMQGRSEWLIAVDAIWEKPIIGHGSWASDIDNKYTYLRALRAGADWSTINQILDRYQMNVIPVHSVLMAAWIWCGLLGFIASVFILKPVVHMMIAIPAVKSPYIPVVVFYTLMIVWDFFFSPPQSIRLNFPHALAFLIVLTAPYFKRKSLLYQDIRKI